jgi:hypothetical protein
LLQISDILFEVVKVLFMKLLLKIILDIVDPMLLVELVLQVLELSVNSSLLLVFFSLFLLSEGLFILLVQSDGKLMVVGLILDNRMLKVILLVQLIVCLRQSLLGTREFKFVVEFSVYDVVPLLWLLL